MTPDSEQETMLVARPDAATVDALYDIIAHSDSRAIAVIGLVKNAGKTTVVNALMENCDRVFGLTSLGLDGERTDHLTGLAKPSIVPPAGTLVATTRGSLERSRYAMEALEELPFHTPLGRVVIGRAGGDAPVEVSGPTTLAELRVTVDRLADLGAGQILVDGAINRIGSASPRVSDGVVVATGGMVGDTLDDVLETTVGALDMLMLPEVSAATRRLVAGHAAAGARAVLFAADGPATDLAVSTVVGEGVTVAREVERREAHTLLIGGALTQEFVDDFTRVLSPRTPVRVVVRDATVLVLPPAMVSRFARRGLSLEVLTPLRVLALTVNPFRVPQPYQPKIFFSAIADVIGDRVPVFDVVNGLARLPQGSTAEPEPYALSLMKVGGQVNDALRLDADLVDRARTAANAVADDIQQHIEEHTTDTTERATLRLLGIEGVNEIDVPFVNVVVEHARKMLPGGIMRPFVDGMLRTGKSAQELAEAVAAGDFKLTAVPEERRAATDARAEELAKEGVARIDSVRTRRNQLVAETGEPLKPYLYVIVATGNIYEDASQAKAAARAGADVVAVIRTTAQSLLDYVPYGETTEGFGGTYATQENFRLMRAALDEVGEELGRYIRLCNYASGLCMPEIATMGALERLDMMLNDSMYGIIFRNINMQRTFVDQYLSRLINARAGIIINTGEDNYLTTADAFEKGYTVVSSDFINEAFALRANLEPWQIGLGHAFEINPQTPDQVVYQIADAQLIRQLFPDYPLKYMPPTKYMPGDIFQGHIIDGMFNFTGIFTGQEIMLLGMLTEALHTPLLQDRYVSIKNAKYVFEGCRDLAGEVTFKPGGMIEQRANDQLQKAVEQLEHVQSIGLFKALENGEFADVKRDPSGGRGFEGVFKVTGDYFNPFFSALRKGQMSGAPEGPAPGGSISTGERGH